MFLKKFIIIEPITRVRWKPRFTGFIDICYWQLNFYIIFMKIKMNNSIFELVKSHCIIFDKNLQNVKLSTWIDENWHVSVVNWLFQLDFLARYVDDFRIENYWIPWFDTYWIKDNPNWIPSEYENVYIKSEFHGENVSIDYQLVIPDKSPVAILNRWYFKVRKWKDYVWRWRISIYGKALKLYYMWYIPRLKEYVIKYNWECSRADLCWDFPCEFPNWIIDLNISWTNHSTVYFWEKSSPLFFRKYDKTQDLKREKNCFAWLYPERYKKECWRLEAQLSGEYSRSMSPLDWLDIVEVDKSKIQKQDKLSRNVYKTALYSVINTIDWINLSSQEKLDILINSKKLLDNKIKKLKKQVF